MSFKRHHLLYFVTVAESGQITLAAEKLHIAQPALSQAITQLETAVGFQLFERHPRGVTLTTAGEVFLDKARRVLAAAEDVALTAESLVRAGQAKLALGYLGLPLVLTNPDLSVAFTEAHSEIVLSLHELPFPTLPTVSWLGGVDAAICTSPTTDPDVSFQPLRHEPRMVLAPSDHPLADRQELTVEDVLDETFLGFDPSIDPAWGGFWSLDDHRGGPPREIVQDHVTNAHQRFAAFAAGRGIATAPACHAVAVANVLPTVVAIPLLDADPAVLTLVARKDRDNPLVEALFATAKQLAVPVAQGAATGDA